MNDGNLDVSQLPTFARGPRSVLWWGTLSFIVIEGTFLAVLLAVYFYGARLADVWPPPGARPLLALGTVNTVVLLLSLWPNHLYHRAADAHRLAQARRWLAVTAGFTLTFVVVRIVEFTQLPVRWDANFYGSILWTLLGVHALIVVSDLVETFVLLTVSYRRSVGGRRFGDLAQNALYWKFVVWSWVPIYLLIYVVPQFQSGGSPP